jgi:hypothetical protein
VAGVVITEIDLRICKIREISLTGWGTDGFSPMALLHLVSWRASCSTYDAPRHCTCHYQEHLHVKSLVHVRFRHAATFYRWAVAPGRPHDIPSHGAALISHTSVCVLTFRTFLCHWRTVRVSAVCEWRYSTCRTTE